MFLANYRRLHLSGAAEQLNEGTTARYSGEFSGDFLETGTGWRMMQS